MQFEVKQTRAYPAEFTVSTPYMPEATAVFSGPSDKERAEHYAAFLNGDQPELIEVPAPHGHSSATAVGEGLVNGGK